MKKLACLMVAAVLLVVSMIPAFAASGINEYEQKLMNYVETAYVVDGVTITAGPEFTTMLENVLTTVDLTEAQYNEIIGVLDEALAFVKSKNLTEIEDITKTGSTKALLDYANRALGVVGYSVSTKGSLADADHGLLIITDANGKVVAELHPAITKTGASYTAAAVCGAAALAVLCAAGVSVKRLRKADED